MTFKASGYATLITVKNMERAVKFYTRVLDGKVLHRPEGEMHDYWASVRVGEEEFWLVAPEENEKRELAYSVFVVEDIKGAVADLKGKGVKFDRAEKSSAATRIEGPIAYEPFGANAFFKDSEGNLLMLWEIRT